MDAKQRANFINSIESRPEPVEEETAQSGFAPIQEEQKKEPKEGNAFAEVKSEQKSLEEEENAFAQGLPAWDLLPPQLAVRKRRSV